MALGAARVIEGDRAVDAYLQTRREYRAAFRIKNLRARRFDVVTLALTLADSLGKDSSTCSRNVNTVLTLPLVTCRAHHVLSVDSLIVTCHYTPAVGGTTRPLEVFPVARMRSFS